MKKYVLLIVLLCIAYTRVNAQMGRGYFYQNTNRTFYGGLEAGLNFSAVAGDNYDGYHKLGFNGGAVVYSRLFRRLLASVELLYTMKGSRGVREYESYYTGTFIEKYYLDLNYVEIPLVFHFLLDDKWNVGLGASYAQLLKSKEELYTDQPVFFDPNKYRFRSDDYNLVISGGMQLYKGWFLSMRYQYSLTTIRDYDKIPPGYGIGKEANNLFSLRLVRLID